MVQEKLSEQIVSWLREYFRENGRDTAVLGISGGKDSSVVASLCAKALGPEHVVGVLMPNGEQADIADSEQLVEFLGIRSCAVNIATAYKGMIEAIYAGLGINVTPVALTNIPPRLRMTVLYPVAQTLSEHEDAHACVVGTGNRSEAEVGYTTKWGDSACDVNPIRDLWVDEVISVGKEQKLPDILIYKTPSDGLCGKTDEENLGFPYDAVRAFVEGTLSSLDPVYDAIAARHASSAHKRNPIPFFKK